MNGAQPLATGTLVLALLGGALGTREWGRDLHPPTRYPSILSSVQEPGPMARLMGLEHGPMFGDLWWLQVIQETGEAESSAQLDPEIISTWSQAATDFDPRYLDVYYNGAILLSAWAQDAQASNRLLRKGVQNLPTAWQLHFMLGFNHYFIEADPRAASDAWARAGALEGAPAYVSSLAARSRFQSGDRQSALRSLRNLVKQLPPGRRKDLAEGRLKLLRNELLFQRLDAACDAYFEAHGRLPDAVEDLRRAGLWDGPMEDLFGDAPWFEFVEMTGDATDCITRSEQMQVRESEATGLVGAFAPKENAP